MPDRPNSTQQAVEKLERYGFCPDCGEVFPPGMDEACRCEQDQTVNAPRIDHVRLSDVLNALQDVEGEGDDEQVTRVFRDLREDDKALERISRAIHLATISNSPSWPRARAAVDAIFAYLAAAPARPVLKPPGEGDGGQVGGRLRDAVRSLLALRRGTGPKEVGDRYLPDNEATRTALGILDAAFHAPAKAAIRAALSQPQAGEEGKRLKSVHNAGNLKADGTLLQPGDPGYVNGSGEIEEQAGEEEGS